jgi:hypothetical protein
MAFTLMSVSYVNKAEFSLFIKSSRCVIQSLKLNIIGCIPLIWGLYYASGTLTSSSTPVVNSASKLMLISELHHRMGHINHKGLCRMVKEGMVTGIKLDFDSKPEFCEPCIKAKADQKPFLKKSDAVYKAYGDKVIADLWGPARVESLEEKKYYFLFKLLNSQEEKVYFLQAKSDAFTHYKKYKAWALVQYSAQIKIFGCDCAGELMSKEFNNHLENAGTVCHLTIHDSLASNGAVE